MIQNLVVETKLIIFTQIPTVKMIVQNYSGYSYFLLLGIFPLSIFYGFVTLFEGDPKGSLFNSYSTDE